ncbi:MAG: L-threonylcarbamoyladenylate synthase [Chlorobiaceae bacterium]
MQTIVTDSAGIAADFLNSGGVVAFPTETVYGLGAGICCAEAVDKVFCAKGRPGDNPLIVHIHSVEQLGEVAREINADARVLIDRFFPGPLTLVLKKSCGVPYSVTAGLDTVGVRWPSNRVAREFLSRCCCPVAAPSANLSGLPSATSWEAVYEDLDGKIECVLRGEPSDIGLESTIVDCSGSVPVLLRAGAISLEVLQGVLPDVVVYAAKGEGGAPKSPGLKYPHYAPKAAIFPVCANERAAVESGSAYIGLSVPPEGVSLFRVCVDLEEYGRELFSFFRYCDARKIRVIYCELPADAGIGRAIRDRVLRAAGSR